MATRKTTINLFYFKVFGTDGAALGVFDREPPLASLSNDAFPAEGPEGGGLDRQRNGGLLGAFVAPDMRDLRRFFGAGDARPTHHLKRARVERAGGSDDLAVLDVGPDF